MSIAEKSLIYRMLAAAGGDMPRGVRSLGDTYDLDALEIDWTRPSVSVADLPSGWGWGAELDAKIGGLRPGTMIAVAAARAKAGKSSFALQLADGLSLRTHKARSTPGAILTPVIVASEMSPRLLAQRTVARAASIAVQSVRSPASDYDRNAVREVYGKHTDLAAAVDLVTHVNVKPSKLYATLTTIVESFKDGVWRIGEDAAPEPDLVWPVIVVDPIQRFLSSSDDRTSALDELLGDLIRLKDELGCIVLLTSDSTKSAAADDKGGLATRAVGAFRSSYALIHSPDVCLFLDPATASPSGWTDVGCYLVANRWGEGDVSVGFQWHARTGLYRAASKARPAEKVPARGL
jgi:hypothetical protein